MEPDPFQPGHLLVALDTGDYLTGPGYLYASSDYGASWQAVAMPQALARITDITFDPGDAGAGLRRDRRGRHGTGVYRSTDHGVQLEAHRRPDATGHAHRPHDRHRHASPAHAVLRRPRGRLPLHGRRRHLAEAARRSRPAASYLFADGDSTRLYAGDSTGLYFSSDGGDTWTRAAGAFGRLQIPALGSAGADGHTIIYAATNGGQAGDDAAAPARDGAVRRHAGASARATAAASRMVSAGIYRYVVVQPKMTLKLSGLSRRRAEARDGASRRRRS